MKKLLTLLVLLLLSSPAQAINTPPGTTGNVITNAGNKQFGAQPFFDPTYQSVAIPVGTTGQRPASPDTAWLRWNSTTPGYEFWNGSTWSAFSTGTTPPGGSNGQLQYNNAGVFGGIANGNTFTTINNTANYSQPADRIVAGTTDTILASDLGRVVKYTSSSAVAITLPAANTTGFTQGFAFVINNTGTGLDTVTPASGTINGSSTLQLASLTGCWVRSDNTNWQIDYASGGCFPISVGNLPANARIHAAVFSGIGPGSAVATGSLNPAVPIPFSSATIFKWCIVGDVSSTTQFDVWKNNGSIPTSSGQSIVASAPPVMTSATQACSSTLTGWTTSLVTNDYLLGVVSSNNNAARLSLYVYFTIN